MPHAPIQWRRADGGAAMERPEVHHPHARHVGLPRWLELVIAITALVTSISSIAIAVHHGRVMEKLVQANSLPYLQGGFSDATPEGARVLSLDFYNRGIGPAHERSLRVKVDGRYVTSLKEMLEATFGPADAARTMPTLGTLQNRVRTRFVTGGDEQMVFRIPKSAQNADDWDRLQAAQGRWEIEYCYCSVFDECWEVLGKWEEPSPVAACPRDETREFLP
jgi:hypothetical protein